MGSAMGVGDVVGDALAGWLVARANPVSALVVAVVVAGAAAFASQGTSERGARAVTGVQEGVDGSSPTACIMLLFALKCCYERLDDDP
jgi:hypothetical protein